MTETWMGTYALTNFTFIPWPKVRWVRKQWQT